MNRQPLISDFADDQEMAEILREFVEGMKTTGDRLHQSLQAGNLEEVRRIGHQMKGAGASYGFDDITHAGAALERAVEQEHEIQTRADELCELFNRAQVGLETFA